MQVPLSFIFIWLKCSSMIQKKNMKISKKVTLRKNTLFKFFFSTMAIFIFLKLKGPFIIIIIENY